MTDDHEPRSDESPTRTLPSSRRRFLSGVGAAAGVALAPTASAAAARQAQPQAEVVASFEPPNLPENLATDDGTVYTSMAPAHEVWRVSPEGDASSVATVGPADGAGSLLGLARADDGTMYGVLNSGSEETHGVWEIPPDGDGSAELMASIPVEGTFPNGVTTELLDDALIVSDSGRGVLWRVTGGGAEVWLDSSLLNPNPYADSPIGVNGVEVGPNGDLYAANLNFGAVVRFPVEGGSPAGEPTVLARSDGLAGADGLTVADDGTVYTAVNALDKVSRVSPDGSIETVAAGGNLAFPADVHFGPGDDQSTLYVANFALTAFEAEDRTANPSVMRIDLGGQ